MKKKSRKAGRSSSPVAAIVLAIAFVVTAGYCIMLQSQLKSSVAKAEDCAGGNVRYDMENVDFSFCYPEEFGTVTENETSISAEARTGTRYHVSFAESATALTVETADFAKIGDSDVASVLPGGYVCLAAAADDVARESCFNEMDEVVGLLSRRDAAGRLRVSAHLKLQQIEGEKVEAAYIFVNDVLGDGRYNMSISSPTSEAGQLVF